MFRNKPVKSRTIWISLLTSMFHLAIIGEVISASPVTPQSISRQEIVESEAESDTEKPEAEADNSLEKAIIAELNRVRTNPQSYADWLESQKQYYQGMLLKLPGEQPIRTNRGLRSLEEAITFLRQQQELPALSASTELTSAARQQITAINNNRQARHSLVYGKVTPEAIVMQLVVDDGFPDRPHRLAIFNRNHQNTGIACSEIPVYNNVCAIAYKNMATAAKPAEANTEESATENNSQLPISPEANASTTSETEANREGEVKTPATSEPEVIITTKPASETDIPEIANNNQTDSNVESEIIENSTTEEEKSERVTARSSSDNSDLETEVPESADTDSRETPTETSEEAIATTETATDSEIAATSNVNTPSQAVEIVERGTLEEGDDVIPNDGSFYDSYPLEGSAGDSFVITLESEDFDTFLAIMDRDGNIIEQNDDADEQNSNSRLEITLSNDGTYSVIVNAYEQQGTGDYVLTVRR